MQMVATRTRSAGAEPLYQYMLLVPFDQLAEARQARIHYRTDFGGGRRGEPHARLAEVIAPIEHLSLAPGLDRHHEGTAIRAVARRLETILIGAIFPEVVVPLLPSLLLVSSDPSDAQVFTRADDLAGRYGALAPRIDTLSATALGLLA